MSQANKDKAAEANTVTLAMDGAIKTTMPPKSRAIWWDGLLTMNMVYFLFTFFSVGDAGFLYFGGYGKPK